MKFKVRVHLLPICMSRFVIHTMGFKLVLLDVNNAFLDKARHVFKSTADVRVHFHHGNVRDYQPRENTAFVSPANSLGFMDGGIDAAYMMMFNGVQQSVRSSIRQLGMTTGLGRPYLPIGSALYVSVDDTNVLISSPTMFLPHNVASTQNAYHAFMASLCMFEKARLTRPSLSCIVCPAMCTGYGCMPAEQSVEQMHRAFEDFMHGKRPDQIKMADTPWCFITPLHDHEQPKIFDNREIQE